jgi:anaerobic selenocysteine-containing dehydrogenase
VADFTPERCAGITGIFAEQIERAATAFAGNRPAGILPALGCSSQQNDAFDLNRALTMLSAITGNLDVPGGNLHGIPPTGDRFFVRRGLFPHAHHGNGRSGSAAGPLD